jgi:hypothetical protein
MSMQRGPLLRAGALLYAVENQAKLWKKQAGKVKASLLG